MNKIKITKSGLISLIFLTIAQLHQSGIAQVYYLTAIIISFLFFVYGSAKKCALNIKTKDMQDAADATIIICVQWIVVFIYNISIHILGIAESNYTKSSLIQMTFPLIVLLGGWGLFCLFREQALKYLIYSIVLNFICVIIYQLFKVGPIRFMEGILTVFTGLSVGNPLESNADTIFSLGLILIFLANKRYFDGSKNNKKIIALLLVIFLCGKRSEAFALGILVLFALITAFIPRRKLYILERMASIMLIILYYIYLYTLKNGILYSILSTLGINTMGRMNMWSYIMSITPFSLSYMGKGYSFGTLTIENNRVWTYKGAVYGLHGGVLAFYADLGFIMFGLWMVYNLLIVPKFLLNKYGYKVVNLYWELTVYLFILYLTESSINQPITQAAYIVIILTVVIKSQSNRSQKQLTRRIRL